MRKTYVYRLCMSMYACNREGISVLALPSIQKEHSSQLVRRMYSAGLLAAAFHHHIDWDRIYLLYKPQESSHLTCPSWMMVCSTLGIGEHLLQVQATEDREMMSWKALTT